MNACESAIFIYNQIIFGCKKNEILSRAAKQSKLEDMMSGETSQTLKDKYHIFYIGGS